MRWMLERRAARTERFCPVSYYCDQLTIGMFEVGVVMWWSYRDGWLKDGWRTLLAVQAERA